MAYTKHQLADRALWVGLYGECVSKSYAARIISVTRKTIYNMIDDGRLDVYGNGMVSVRSLWHYVTFGKGYKGKLNDRPEKMEKIWKEAAV